ncbi:hypothetical protein [Bacillus suaedaesalsae]|uniref:XRE family transcriptional regulator n=1 Tax=Bacillus suaedaesalsae TaxID=2810349 RepID=A0ABS2DDR0_9BACI|nr:hypothetical protein [Bacillus suaedaesalsae]MBM6616587.1 hypothetical protein [Bacillus suaedaesalsae]
MLDQKLLQELESYIDLHINLMEFPLQKSADFNLYEELHSTELETFIQQKRQPSFKEVLLRYIDDKNVSDAEIYTRAGIDRRHFSKIRSTPNYKPKKSTVAALCLALELNADDTDTLLNAAGYSLSDSDTSDLILQFFIDKEMYNLHDVNLALDHFSLKTIP